ncbi:ethanolaminephosphotransferase 1-like [Corticium candelabrum]|uniref:ethanolaminephosphotransferase 1-like n=1 Tax=Corticium candelabrum TaxID=121492 RepID=UPI002E26C477|nr:ethanolaminephosphotransferase 1-like [Corticium candelabrum]
MFPSRYLTERHLAGFDKYKYSAVDTSPLANYIMHPFWNRVVQFYPKWLAANVLTFGGVLLLVLNYSLFAYYDYDFNTTCNDLGIKRSPIPQWVFLVCAVSQFVSHTMDGTDGKQARRTNASSPLGELFDHGFDSLSVVITVPPMFSLFGMCDEWGDNIWISNVIYLGCMFCFYLPHWEKTVTGVLFLSWSYDASQLGCAGVYLICWWFGTEFLQTKPAFGVRVKSIADTTFAVIGIASVFCTCWNIYSAIQKGSPKLGSSSVSGLLLRAFFALCPVVFAFGFSLMWAVLSPSNIMEMQPRAFFLMEGFLFSNACCRLIISEMSGTSADKWNWLCSPLLLIIPLAYLRLVDETIMLMLYCSVLAIYHIHYGVRIVQELCDHLNIFCFSIKKRN